MPLLLFTYSRQNLDAPPPEHRASTLDWVWRYPLTGSNLVYGTHLYRNPGAGPLGAVNRNRDRAFRLWDRADVQHGLELCGFLRVLQELRKPVLVTELGPYMRYANPVDQEHELLWLRNTAAVLNAWSIGYIGWGWAPDPTVAHGMLHEGVPNAGGRVFLETLQTPPAVLREDWTLAGGKKRSRGQVSRD